jgi:hypothetical protein
MGYLIVALADGEVFKGRWQAAGRPAPASSPPAPGSAVDLTADWDYVYGPGYYRAHVLGSRLYSRASLTGSAGSTAVVEVYNEFDRCGGTHGVARDSHDNVYKVTVNSGCVQPDGRAIDAALLGPSNY